MERGLKGVVLTIVALFAALTLWTGYWSVIAAPALQVHPRNPRLQWAELRTQRGAIYAADMQLLAVSEEPGKRSYVGPPSLAHTVGYADRRFGKSGLELAYNAELLGMSQGATFARTWAELTGGTWRGWDVITTIRPELQAAAARALGERTGAVVALDPHDGAVLAIVSVPGFDPNDVEAALRSSGGKDPLFNRATLGQYPPGSAFKPLVLAAALEAKTLAPTETFLDEGFVTIGGRRIENAGNEAHGRIAVDDALALSSNAFFATLAHRTGAAELTALARRFGFGSRPPLEIPAAAGRVPTGEELRDAAALAAVGIGQGTLLVTPLQMALLAAGIANGGWLVEPHLVRFARDESGRIHPIASPGAVRVLSPGAAQFVRETMIAAVARGTATAAALEGVLVAGKTGTAEVEGRRPHAWFIGFAPARDPQVAVAVVVENGGAGGAVAAPIAREVFAAALAGQGNGVSVK